MKNRSPTPREFATTAHIHVTRLSGRPSLGRPRIPTEAELQELVDIAFFAGLHEEEARPTETTLVWQPEDGAIGVVRLKEPVEATAEKIAKLAPAAERDRTPLAVRTDGDRVVIWGLVNQGSMASLYLTVRTLAPGVVRIDYGPSQVALYARGDVRFQADPTDGTPGPSRIMTEVFGDWRKEAETNGREVATRAAVVLELARLAFAHGHGGMILVAPATEKHENVRDGYAIEDAGLLQESLVRLLEGCERENHIVRVLRGQTAATPDVLEEEDPPTRLFRRALAFCSKLTAVDGALLIDTSLKLHGFGAHVVAPPESGGAFDFEQVDPGTWERARKSLGSFRGTRHTSGIRYCMHQKGGAAAIIMSQDARVTLAVGGDGNVTVYRAYERGFGWC